MIKNVVQRESYQLVDEKTGKTTRDLVTNDRIKAYNMDRQNFNERLTSLYHTSDELQQTVTKPSIDSAAEATPIEIIREQVCNGKKQYIFQYSDNRMYPCHWVNEVLLRHFRNKKKQKPFTKKAQKKK